MKITDLPVHDLHPEGSNRPNISFEHLLYLSMTFILRVVTGELEVYRDRMDLSMTFILRVVTGHIAHRRRYYACP